MFICDLIQGRDEAEVAVPVAGLGTACLFWAVGMEVKEGKMC